MKTFITLFTLVLSVLFITPAMAWVSTPTAEKPYSFKFNFENEKFQYEIKAPSYEEAYEKAAQACFNHYKGGRRVSMDRGMDIIDVCANPRSI